MFTGSIGAQKRIDLSGKKKDDSREEVLRKAREEREKRQRQRLEATSATIIQKHWRAHLDLLRRRAQEERAWSDTYLPLLTPTPTPTPGSSSSAYLTASPVPAARLLHPSSPFLPQLLYFFEKTSASDISRLAATCRVINGWRYLGGGSRGEAGGGGGVLGLASLMATLPQHERGVMQVRLVRLVRCLVGAMEAAAPGGVMAGSTSLSDAEAVCQTMSDMASPDTWTVVLGDADGKKLHRALLLGSPAPPPPTPDPYASSSTSSPVPYGPHGHTRRRAAPLLPALAAIMMNAAAAGAPPGAAGGAAPPPFLSAAALCVARRAPEIAMAALSDAGGGAEAGWDKDPLRSSLLALLCVPGLGAALSDTAAQAARGGNGGGAAASLLRASMAALGGMDSGAVAAEVSRVAARRPAWLDAARPPPPPGPAPTPSSSSFDLSPPSLLPLTALSNLLACAPRGLPPLLAEPSRSSDQAGPSQASQARQAGPLLRYLDVLGAVLGAGGMDALNSFSALMASGSPLPPPCRQLEAGLALLSDRAFLLHLTELSETEKGGPFLPLRSLSLLLFSAMGLGGAGGGGGGWRDKVIRALAPTPKFVQSVWRGLLLPLSRDKRALLSDAAAPAALAVFSAVLRLGLMLTSDQDLHTKGTPLPPSELWSPSDPSGGVVGVLRDALWGGMGGTTGWGAEAPLPVRLAFRLEAGRLFSLLYDRNDGKRFAPQEEFQAAQLRAAPGRFAEEVCSNDALLAWATQTDSASSSDDDPPGGGRGEAGRAQRAQFLLQAGPQARPWAVLFHAPALVPFTDRAQIFQALVSRERRSVAEFESGAFFRGQFSPQLRVHRDSLVGDGAEALGGMTDATQWKRRFRVQFVNSSGLEEAGVDGGGLFKEFLSQFLMQSCDVNLGLFRENGERQLYPSPSAGAAVPDFRRLMRLVGAMVGKALWEGILLEVPFARFFLKKVRGGSCDLHDLPSLDPQLHQSLLYLRGHPEEVGDMALTFAVEVEHLGARRQVNLIPNGASIPVTSDNFLRYIHLVAHYYLNAQIQEQCSAFLSGFYLLVDRRFVEFFHDHEMQQLLSGTEAADQAGLDLDDLKRHAVLRGPGGAEIPADHPALRALWGALSDMSPAQQSKFLKFVTSCARPPLLGFRYLEPKISVYVLDGSTIGRLPTAATCMNLLKLPPYTKVKVMKEKLITAVESGSGFELS